MKQKRKWILCLCLLLATLTKAQTTVKGTVVDPSNEPLIGVTVQVVGQTGGGAVTDLDGNYAIKVPAQGSLKFSYIGYQDQTIAVAGKTVINVTMREDAEVLQEVVVVGYGTQKKESLTGAVTVVDGKAFESKGSLSSPLQALQGQVAGVMITRSSSAPGEEGWNMKLRGSVSKNSGGPLVIIDGVAGDMGSVNPSDIESINFLKDGSAAIYGSRAADGVVLITTKKGKEGQVRINYTGSLTVKTPGLQPETMSLGEWADGLMQTLENDNNTSSVWYTYAQLAKQYQGRYIDLSRSANPFGTAAFTDVSDFVFSDVDWLGGLFGNAYDHEHNLSVSGGSEKNSYRISLGYNYNGSNLQYGNNSNKRFNVRFNDTYKFTNASFRLSQQMDGIYAMPLSIAADYVHPGLLHTADDIALAKSRLDKDPFKSAYARLEATSAAQPAGAVEYLKRMDQANWQSTYPDYSNFTAAATDARLAYQLALRYQLKGSTAAATAAVNILNDWARNNKGMLRLAGYNNNIPDPNEYLICIQAHQFANAAELLRNYEGWQAADFQQFQNWIRTTFADVAILFLDNHQGNENALHYWMNWDMAALTAMYSVGVLCNDKALVDYALNYTTAGAGTGAVNNAIVATVQDPDSQELLAQCQESGRDQGHATLDVSLLGAFCKMAQSQGTDLFTPYKALEMAEYVGKYNLMTAEGNFVYDASRVPFTGYTNGEVSHTTISADARGTVRPSWELFHAYALNAEKADAYCAAWVKYQRNANAWGEAEAATTDELGYGTLMFATETTEVLTGIDASINDKQDMMNNHVVYDLQGRRVSNAEAKKGLYLINGKKIVVK